MKIAYETDRLLLREFTDADAPSLYALDSDPDVVRFVGQPPPASVEPYLDAIRGRYRRYYERHPGFGFWAAVERATGSFVGWFHLRPAGDYRFAAEAGYRPGDFDLGYRLARAAWGRGYATEVSRLLVRRAFADLGVSRVVACVLSPNVASIRVLEKAGLRRQGEARLPGFESPALVYAASIDEYSARST